MFILIINALNYFFLLDQLNNLKFRYIKLIIIKLFIIKLNN